jgi:hypothetical protein
MALLKGRLLAGALFAGALYASDQVVEPPVVQEYQWDTAQGVAKNAFVKFEKIQDNEAVVQEASLVSQTATVVPYAEASADIFGDTLYAQHFTPQGIKANGFADVKTKEYYSYTGSVHPEADSSLDIIPVNASFNIQLVEPTAGAEPVLAAVNPIEASQETITPKGIRNPTDEEMLVIIQTIRRRRAA